MSKITTTSKKSVRNGPNLRKRKPQARTVAVAKTKPIKKTAKATKITRPAEKSKVAKTAKATAKQVKMAGKKEAAAKAKANSRKQSLKKKISKEKAAESKKDKATLPKSSKAKSSAKQASKASSKSVKKTKENKVVSAVSLSKGQKQANDEGKKQKKVEEAVRSFKEKKEKAQRLHKQANQTSPEPLTRNRTRKAELISSSPPKPKQKRQSKKKSKKSIPKAVPPEVVEEKQPRKLSKYIQMRLDTHPILPEVMASTTDYQPPSKTAKKSTKSVLKKSEEVNQSENLPHSSPYLGAIEEEITVKTEELEGSPKQARFKTISELERIQRSRKERIFLIEAERKESEWRFKVMGSHGKPYTTEVGAKLYCSCVDFRFTKRPCKHLYFIVTQVAQAERLLECFEGSIDLSSETYAALDEQLVRRLKARMQEGQRGVELKDDTSCVICFCEMETHDPLEDCPSCKKYFHSQCLAMWKKHNNSCPLCRAAFAQDALHQLAELIL